jgi:3-phenylpropionate/cinnamic acid dioxygenase small subunit
MAQKISARASVGFELHYAISSFLSYEAELLDESNFAAW